MTSREGRSLSQFVSRPKQTGSGRISAAANGVDNFHLVTFLQVAAVVLATRDHLEIDLYGNTLADKFLLFDQRLYGRIVIAFESFAVESNVHLWLLTDHERGIIKSGRGKFMHIRPVSVDGEGFFLLCLMLGMPGNTNIQPVAIIIFIGSYFQM